MSSQGMKLGVEATAIWERRGKHQMKIAVFVKSLLPTLAKMVCLDIPAGWDQASNIMGNAIIRFSWLFHGNVDYGSDDVGVLSCQECWCICIL